MARKGVRHAALSRAEKNESPAGRGLRACDARFPAAVPLWRTKPAADALRLLTCSRSNREVYRTRRVALSDFLCPSGISGDNRGDFSRFVRRRKQRQPQNMVHIPSRLSAWRVYQAPAQRSCTPGQGGEKPRQRGPASNLAGSGKLYYL